MGGRQSVPNHAPHFGTGGGRVEAAQARESGPLGRPVPGRKSCAIQLQNNFGGSKRNNLGGRQVAWGGGGVVQVGARENEKKTPRLSLLCKKLHRAIPLICHFFYTGKIFEE